MLGIRNLYKLLMSNVVNPLGVVPNASKISSISSNPTLMEPSKINVPTTHDSMAKALIAVFGMGKDGRIPKEKACNVVKQLGLVKENDGESRFEILEEELEVNEVLNGLEKENNEKEEILREVFRVFDVDGDGFIDANEIKRIFVCLGLDNGWNISEIENMIKVVDINLDGKVDFHEFELMMV